MQIIENEFLRVTVLDRGAELCGIYDREKDREVLWDADPAYWGRHAPLLFPAVGALYQNTYRRHNVAYPMEKHGFARDTDFVCTGRSDTSVTHVLFASPETLAKWPFDFCLEVTHTLCGRELKVSWMVTNPGEETIYFTIGGHPAFRVPALKDTQKTDYFLSFEHRDAVTHRLLNLQTGNTIPETAVLPLSNGTCPITEHLFDCDTLVFDHHDVEKAGILYPDGTPYVEVAAPGFPNFGIWSPPGAPFVCLEPWMGRCDESGFEGDISEKENINAVAPGEIFQKYYLIKVS